MKALFLRAVRWSLRDGDDDPETARGLFRLMASGILVLLFGVALATRTFVRNGFRWPKA